MPLRVRLALIAAIGLAIVLLGTGFAFVQLLRNNLTATFDATLWSRRYALLAALRDQPHVTVGPGLPASGVLQSGTQLFTAQGALAVRSAADVDDTGTAPLLTPGQVAKARGGIFWLTIKRADTPAPVRVLAFPLPWGTGDAVGVVSEPMAVVDQAVDHVEAGFLFGGPVVVVGGAIAAWLLAGAALRPVERMRRQAARATVRDVGPVLDVPGTRDEVAELALTLNAMLGRLGAAIARERTFVANAGHELRTPLSVLRTELELAAKPSRTRGELIAAVAAAGEETERLIRLTEGLLLLAREQDERFLHPEPVAVRAVLEAAVAGFAARAAERQVRLLVDVQPDDLTATWDQDLIRQVVANLVDNALRYACRAGQERTAGVISVTAAGLTDRVVLSVRDDGPGFPVDFLPHAFERFSRPDTARGRTDGGAGLGLSIVELISGAHGGQARVANRPEGGAEITVELPEPQ